MSALIVDIEAVGIDNAVDYLDPVEPDPKLLEPIEYDARLKDPAKVEANRADVDRKRAERPALIEASIQERTAALVDRCALDPDLCRIVALGCGDADGDDTSLICRDEAQEAAALRLFWSRVVNVAGATRTLISFNGFGYDLPVLMRRSAYLGVDYPQLNLDRYRSPHIDLMQVLTFRGAIKAHKLSFYASRFGYASDDTVTGADIAALVKAGDWAAVEAHNLSDLKLTRFVAQKLRVIPGMRVAA